MDNELIRLWLSEAGGRTSRRHSSVIGQHKQRLQLITERGEAWGKLKTASFYLEEDAAFPTVGDFVQVQFEAAEEGTNFCLITDIMPRRNVFYRYNGATERSGKQAVAANLDYIWIMTSCNQEFNIRRIQRYIAQTWQSGIQPVLILTKGDLIPEWQGQALQEEAELAAPGVPVHRISSQTGEGMQALDRYLRPGLTIALLGSSGVGKSSLTNALLQEEAMKTSSIREQDGRGRHTTTYRQLLRTKSGALIIDTPGMRTVNLWDNQEGVQQTFPMIQELAAQCRYRDCTHHQEPGCAVRRAVEEGRLSEEQWKTYLNLEKEAAYSRQHLKNVANKNWRKIEKIKNRQELKKDRRQNHNIYR